ncbi:hypothetical protein H0H93_000792, partial [Arthromyces matolae]
MDQTMQSSPETPEGENINPKPSNPHQLLQLLSNGASSQRPLPTRESIQMMTARLQTHTQIWTDSDEDSRSPPRRSSPAEEEDGGTGVQYLQTLLATSARKGRPKSVLKRRREVSGSTTQKRSSKKLRNKPMSSPAATPSRTQSKLAATDNLPGSVNRAASSSESESEMAKSSSSESTETPSPSESDAGSVSSGGSHYLPSSPEHRQTPEDEERAHTPPGLDFLDRYFLDPSHWGEAIRSLRDLYDRSWLVSPLIDLWLMKLWQDLGGHEIQYVPTPYLRPQAPEFAREEIDHYRRLFGLDPIGPTPTKVLCGVLHTGGNHFCAIIMDVPNATIHVLGRKIDRGSALDATEQWDEWGGPGIWQNICQLHQWPHVAVSVFE